MASEVKRFVSDGVGELWIRLADCRASNAATRRQVEDEIRDCLFSGKSWEETRPELEALLEPPEIQGVTRRGAGESGSPPADLEEFCCNKCGYVGTDQEHERHTGCRYLAAPIPRRYTLSELADLLTSDEAVEAFRDALKERGLIHHDREVTAAALQAAIASIKGEGR